MSTNKREHKDGIWIIITKDRIVQFVDQPGLIRTHWSELDFAHAYEDQVEKLESHKDEPVYLLDMGAEQLTASHVESVSLRAMLMQIDISLFNLVAKAWQRTVFLRTHRFCGQCGSTMTRVDWELATLCHQCGHRCYPRVSPCIIVAIRKDDKILLAQGKPQQARQMHSVLAGFVEGGETLEQAVHREVMEEVGIRVKNLRYFSSQPWPFPHSLMVGFFAEYDSGDIVVDGKEILEASWYAKDELPNIPPKFSIAGQLIAKTLEDIAE
ncbi:NAD(+) diphosphatase [Alteromonadaceae bacterium M269]|nr:NAD(+) diphosphatase [Alteromonadaceae bacterium M269]